MVSVITEEPGAKPGIVLVTGDFLPGLPGVEELLLDALELLDEELLEEDELLDDELLEEELLE